MEEIKEIGEETKKAIIEEYLKSLLASAPAVNLTGGGGAPTSPKNKPKTLAEAAAYTAEKLGAKL